ncbi:leucyl aminopeptidase [Nocardioides exalbidus]|uniref:Probable cytosol aminopeptidase n=1 Tax=Nocardioides exalbidus TaxID=402596 RepID=A0A1H4JVT0_9ACTN|nr:leucyl aminopeptidase family protein [Nocardioides exalbidus]SEB50410.1 leucyl aminopeptidase [Nocardioides exalbidus]
MAIAQLPTQVSPPEFALSPALPHQVGGAEVWAFPVLPGDDGPLLGPGADEASEALGTDLLAAVEAARATGRTGEVTTVPVSAADDDVSLVLLVGVGDATVTDFRRAGAAVARAAKDRVSVVTSIAAIAPDEGLAAFVVGAMLGSFSFHWRSNGPKEHPVARIVLADVSDDGAADDALARAIALGGAGWRSRALATVPANLKTPAWLADQAVEVGEAAGLDVTVWDAERLRAEGFGGILAVGGGSVNEPRLIRMDYTPKGASKKVPTVVLVGKGITFDSGGLDIKPSEGMLTMKRDMSGGGAVIAAMAALRDVDCPVRVVGLVPAAENSVSGSAMRPGDVITHFGGRTSEVNNTDAEGRLVLADAMAYAVSEIGPAAILDIATLTGAMKVSLGQWTGGFFANHEALAEQVEAAASSSGELVWRMPLVADYEEKVSSRIADGDNAAGGAGAITAALFLQHFAGDVPWAHIDFASAAESPADRNEWTAGPSGWGPRLLLAWLGSDDPLAGIA